MSDLFRGYDLTTVIERVAVAQYERVEGQKPTWEDLSPAAKRNFKEALLPLVTDVLDALEAAVPEPAKPMVRYVDDGNYENQDAMLDKATCTVWTLHLHVHPHAKAAILARMAVHEETTGEYVDGDSWKEWGSATHDEDDQHLAIYFEATPSRAKSVGEFLAISAEFAARFEHGGAEPAPGTDEIASTCAVSTSGDWAEQL